MPFFLHQWSYKDQQFRSLILENRDRAEVVRLATEAFGGTLHSFFYSFGEYDGVAICEFPDQSTAFAALMSISGQGRVRVVHTTPLLTADEGLNAMQMASETVGLALASVDKP
ncbi:MAG: GYD domain-containing protein [Rubrivivax sp.]|nr:MAG: GYD domain-containing protein [Rubrivivax sp.]